MNSPLPFVGLRPFSENDTSLFWGRKADIAQILRILHERGLVILVGKAGDGKTSLLRSGITPALRRTANLNIKQHYLIQPGTNPLHAIAAAVAGDNTSQTEYLYKTLHSNPKSLSEFLFHKGCRPDARSLFIVDNFEELYTITSKTECDQFLDAIFCAYDDQVLTLILVIRQDFLGRATEDSRFLQHLPGSVFHLQPLSNQALRHMIEASANAAGVTFEPRLVKHILSDLQEPGDPHVRLPLLQLVLCQLYERRRSDVITFRDYSQLGNADNLLTTFLTDTLQRRQSDIPLLRQIVSRLVTSSGTRVAVPIDDFAPIERDAFRLLESQGIIRFIAQDGDSRLYIELTYDRLIPALGRALRFVDEQQERGSESFSRLAKIFGLTTLGQKFEQRTKEVQSMQTEYDRLNAEFAQLTYQKAQIARRIAGLQSEIVKDSPQIFLSYAREDEAQVRQLYNQLKNDGMRPWLDKENLLTGVEWDREIRRVIRTSDFVLICFSSHVGIKRGYIQREIRLALDYYNEIPIGQAFLLPVRLEECAIPEDIGKYEYTDLFQPDGYKRLTRSILIHWAARQKTTDDKKL